MRRLAVLALAGSGSAIARRGPRAATSASVCPTRSLMVRCEAVRAWTRARRQGARLPAAARRAQRPEQHVVLGALDALGDVCRDDDRSPTRLASEARTPRPQRPLAARDARVRRAGKRDRERAAISMLAFAMHQTWQVRMYAARAAACSTTSRADASGGRSRRQRRRGGAAGAARRIGGRRQRRLFVAALNRTHPDGGRRTKVRPYRSSAPRRSRSRALRRRRRSSTALAGALSASRGAVRDVARLRLALIERLGELGRAQARR